MASSTLSARVNRRGRAASRRRRSFFLRPVRGSGTDISAIISRESPILPGRWPVRSWYAGASRSPLCPARTRRAAGRTSGTGPSPVDVGRVGGDIHGIGFPPRPHGSPYLSGGLAAIGVFLPRTGSVAYQAWTDLTAPRHPQPVPPIDQPEVAVRGTARSSLRPDVCPVHRRAARQALEGVTMINSGRMLSAGEPLDGNERAGSWSGAATAAAFAYAVRSGRLDLPLPGSGWTRERWAALAALAEEDLSLARLAEGHSDAVAILGRARCQPASRREPLGSLGCSAAWSRPDRDQDRPWLAAGRRQAVLFRGALVHRRAGDRGGAGRQPAVRGQHP